MDNYPKYADVPRALRGQTVRCEVVGEKFIQALEVLEVEGPDPSQGSGSELPPASPPAQPQGPMPPGKDVSIIRQCCVKAAAEFLVGRPEATVEDVLGAAAAFERWITRTA